MVRSFSLSILFSLLIFPVVGQTNVLKQKIEQFTATKRATIGVAVYNFENKTSLSINDKFHYPMQSVFKFPIALAVLHQVDEGKLFLATEIFIKKSDLLPNTWSPIRERYPNGNINLTLAKILEYTVAQSDNNGCDILLRLLGGAQAANDYIRELGIKDMSIKVNEEEQHKSWNVQFRNWTTPNASTLLLRKFYTGNSLSKASYRFLWKAMVATSTGQNGIKAQLPSGTIIAHKTGSSGINEQGITAALNEIGIITLPNGTHYAISIFVSNSKEDTETNEKIISGISKLVWDHFTSKMK